MYKYNETSVLYSRSLLIIHFKYSSVYMSVPNSLSVPSPYLYPWTTAINPMVQSKFWLLVKL